MVYSWNEVIEEMQWTGLMSRWIKGIPLKEDFKKSVLEGTIEMHLATKP